MSMTETTRRRRRNRRGLAIEELMAPEVAEELRARDQEDSGSPTDVAADVIGETEVADQVQEIQNAVADGAEVTTAIEVAETLDDASAALEAIVLDRTPTVMEMVLLQSTLVRAHERMRTEVPTIPSFEGYRDLSDEDARQAYMAEHVSALRCALEESSNGVWETIKAALSKMGEGIAALWKRFVFFCKSAQSQVQQFRRELEAGDGIPKKDVIRFNTRCGHYTGVGNSIDMDVVIKQLEEANDYVYREFFHKLAVFAATGEKQPTPDDDKFAGLPGEPRFRISPRGAGFIENPPRSRVDKLTTPDRQTVLRWIDAFLEEAIYYIQNYESFKSTAEKIYDAVDDAIGDEDGSDAMDAGRRILFARTHACIDAMEAWVQYTVAVMSSCHALLMGLRKAYI